MFKNKKNTKTNKEIDEILKKYKKNSEKDEIENYNNSNLNENFKEKNLNLVSKTIKAEDFTNQDKEKFKNKNVSNNNLEEFIDKDIDYNKFFSSLYEKEIKIKDAKQTIDSYSVQEILDDSSFDPASNTDTNFMQIKNSLHKKGLEFKLYQKKTTYEYYSGKYYYINKLLMHTMLIMFVLILCESILTFMLGNDKLNFDYKVLIIFLSLLSFIPAYYVFKYLYNKKHKTRYKTIFKFSIINSLILVLNGILLIILIAYFFLGIESSTNDKIKFILIPTLYLINIPLSAAILSLLSKSKKYYVN